MFGNVLKSLVIFVGSAVIIPTAVGFEKKNGPKKEDFEHSKCVSSSTKYREDLAYHEICRYGVSCPKEKSDKKITMYCSHANLSECFENKGWKNANQLIGLDETIKIGFLTQGLSVKNGAKTNETCAYFN